MSDYAELKARYDKALRAREIAVAKNEQAEEQLKKLISGITAEFGVSSLEEAKKLLAQKEAECAELKAQIEAELDKVDG